MESLWFEVALVTGITAFGSIFFGHFEERTSKAKRVLKLLFFIALVTGLSATLGRAWALGFLAFALLGVVYIRGFWLPSKGINGLTGEPRDKYYELRGWRMEEADERGTGRMRLHRRRRFRVVGRLRAGATAVAMLLIVLGARPHFASDFGITDERHTRRATTGGEAARASTSVVARGQRVASVAAFLRPEAPSVRLTSLPAPPIPPEGARPPRDPLAGDPALPRAPPGA